MNYISWDKASTACTWLGGELPTEAQWEKAARGGCASYAGKDCKASAVKYPWGQTAPIAGKHAAFSTGAGTGGPKPTIYSVGSGSAQGASPYGAYDMAGNVEEWVLDGHDHSFYASTAATVKDAWNSNSTFNKTLRGGGFLTGVPKLRASSRHPRYLSTSESGVGFRCARPFP